MSLSRDPYTRDLSNDLQLPYLRMSRGLTGLNRFWTGLGGFVFQVLLLQLEKDCSTLNYFVFSVTLRFDYLVGRWKILVSFVPNVTRYEPLHRTTLRREIYIDSKLQSSTETQFTIFVI